MTEFFIPLLIVYLLIEYLYDRWTRLPTRQRQARESKPAKPLKEDPP